MFQCQSGLTENVSSWKKNVKSHMMSKTTGCWKFQSSSSTGCSLWFTRLRGCPIWVGITPRPSQPTCCSSQLLQAKSHCSEETCQQQSIFRILMYFQSRKFDESYHFYHQSFNNSAPVSDERNPGGITLSPWDCSWGHSTVVFKGLPLCSGHSLVACRAAAPWHFPLPC